MCVLISELGPPEIWTTGVCGVPTQATCIDSNPRHKMIRRPPTAITVTANDVAELKAQRERSKRMDATAQEVQHTDNNHTQAQGDAGPFTSGNVQHHQEAEHPADRAARERRERSAGERIGL
ncbi:unnamed protein product [Sympodiomycopsis kandeliae]